MSYFAVHRGSLARHNDAVCDEICFQSRREYLSRLGLAGIQAVHHPDEQRASRQDRNRGWLWRRRSRWGCCCGCKRDGIDVGQGIRFGLAIRPKKFDLTGIGAEESSLEG